MLFRSEYPLTVSCPCILLVSIDIQSSQYACDRTRCTILFNISMSTEIRERNDSRHDGVTGEESPGDEEFKSPT